MQNDAPPLNIETNLILVSTLSFMSEEKRDETGSLAPPSRTLDMLLSCLLPLRLLQIVLSLRLLHAMEHHEAECQINWPTTAKRNPATMEYHEVECQVN